MNDTIVQYSRHMLIVIMQTQYSVHYEIDFHRQQIALVLFDQIVGHFRVGEQFEFGDGKDNERQNYNEGDNQVVGLVGENEKAQGNDECQPLHRAMIQKDLQAKECDLKFVLSEPK